MRRSVSQIAMMDTDPNFSRVRRSKNIAIQITIITVIVYPEGGHRHIRPPRNILIKVN